MARRICRTDFSHFRRKSLVYHLVNFVADAHLIIVDRAIGFRLFDYKRRDLWCSPCSSDFRRQVSVSLSRRFVELCLLCPFPYSVRAEFCLNVILHSIISTRGKRRKFRSLPTVPITHSSVTRSPGRVFAFPSRQ